MEILKLIIAIIISLIIGGHMHSKAEQKGTDSFMWGYCAGVITSFIIDIALK